LAHDDATMLTYGMRQCFQPFL